MGLSRKISAGPDHRACTDEDTNDEESMDCGLGFQLRAECIGFAGTDAAGRGFEATDDELLGASAVQLEYSDRSSSDGSAD